MTPYDHAKRIVLIQAAGHEFTTSLSDGQTAVLLLKTESSEQADLYALRARQVIAEEVCFALRNEDCRLAAEIDEGFRRYLLQSAGQAAEFCREQGRLHQVKVT